MNSASEARGSVRVQGLLVLLIVALLSGETRAEIYGFQAISNNSGVSDIVASQFTVDVSQGDRGQVIFKFANDELAPYGGNIMGIFFDDRAGLGRIVGLAEPAGFSVDFKYPARGQGNFPEGKTLTPSFKTTSWTVFDKGQNKIGPAEYLEVIYGLNEDKTLQDLLNAIDIGLSGGGTGSLRVGLHVGSIGALSELSPRLAGLSLMPEGDSDSFVMKVVPLPGAVLLASLGISSAGLLLRRKNESVGS